MSNLAAKLKPSDTQPLLLAINYLYCCLSLSPAHCADRGSSPNRLVTRGLQHIATVVWRSPACPFHIRMRSMCSLCTCMRSQRPTVLSAPPSAASLAPSPAVSSILLCNGALLAQLQTALSSSSVSLLCGARLLLSSLLAQPDANSTQVCRSMPLPSTIVPSIYVRRTFPSYWHQVTP